MAYDPELAKRLERVVTGEFADAGKLTETRMMGGFGYLLDGNMCVGIHKDMLIVRVGRETAERLIAREHVGPMDFTGKVMKAWATVYPPAIASDQQLREYCQIAIDFVRTLPPKS